MEILCYLDSEFLANFINIDILDELYGNKIQEFSPQVVKLLNFQAKLELKFTELTTVEDCNF